MSETVGICKTLAKSESWLEATVSKGAKSTGVPVPCGPKSPALKRTFSLGAQLSTDFHV